MNNGNSIAGRPACMTVAGAMGSIRSNRAAELAFDLGQRTARCEDQDIRTGSSHQGLR